MVSLLLAKHLIVLSSLCHFRELLCPLSGTSKLPASLPLHFGAIEVNMSYWNNHCNTVIVNPMTQVASERLTGRLDVAWSQFSIFHEVDETHERLA